MMTALVIKGVQIGPMLVKTQPEYLASVFGSMLVTNIIMVIVAMAGCKGICKDSFRSIQHSRPRYHYDGCNRRICVE